jgi:general secretion pathway protein M
MKQYLVQLNDWLATLAPRERLMVLAGAVVVAIGILYFGIWSPLSRAHIQRAAALDSARNVATRLETAAALVQRSSHGGAANRSVSLLSAIDQSSKSPVLGKAPSHIQPEGDKNVNVWVEDVPFDNLVRWLADLELRFGIVVQTADIERQSGVGLVNARLTLTRS